MSTGPRWQLCFFLSHATKSAVFSRLSAAIIFLWGVAKDVGNAIFARSRERELGLWITPRFFALPHRVNQQTFGTPVDSCLRLINLMSRCRCHPLTAAEIALLLPFRVAITHLVEVIRERIVRDALDQSDREQQLRLRLALTHPNALLITVT